MTTQGFLAIWCQIDAADLGDYRNWLTQEHIADRIELPGFHGMRLCVEVDNELSHFFLYLTENVEVLRGPGYRSILDNPSAWTKRIMTRFGPFDRALGQRFVKIGRGFGSHLVVCRIDCDATGDNEGLGALDANSVRETLHELVCLPDTVGVRLLRNDRAITGQPSAEKKMRVGVEGDFDWLLVVESLTEAGARASLASVPDVVGRALPAVRSLDSRVCRTVYGDGPEEGPTA